VYVDGCLFQQFPLTVDEVIAHWDLVNTIIEGQAVVQPAGVNHDSSEDSEYSLNNKLLPSYKDRAFWRQQILRYYKILKLLNRYLDSCDRISGLQENSFPDPPREVYHVWVVHMLQPLAYQKDCLANFNRIIPHTNHLPNWHYLSLPLNQNSTNEQALRFAINDCCDDKEINVHHDVRLCSKSSLSSSDTETYDDGQTDGDSDDGAYHCSTIDGIALDDDSSIKALFPHIDWWMGMDGVRAIHSHFVEEDALSIPLGDREYIQKVQPEIILYCQFLIL
jgi:hypothetical protein